MFKFIAKQLGNPNGAFGHFVMAPLLNMGNSQMISESIKAGNIEQDDYYLDIGFGGGRTLIKALKVITEGKVYGLEPSVTLMERASQVFKTEIERGRLELKQGAVEDLPYESSFFDKVTSINTVYFWTDVPAGLKEIVRVLRPGGIAVLGISARHKMQRFQSITRHGFKMFEPQELMQEVQSAGGLPSSVIPIAGPRATPGDYLIVFSKES